MTDHSTSFIQPPERDSLLEPRDSVLLKWHQVGDPADECWLLKLYGPMGQILGGVSRDLDQAPHFEPQYECWSQVNPRKRYMTNNPVLGMSQIVQEVKKFAQDILLTTR